MPVWGILLIILGIMIGVLIVLYILGKRAQKKQEAAREQMEQQKQRVDLLVIDKKKVKLKNSGLPQSAIDQAGRMAKNSKVPVVKCKIGPRIMTLIADGEVFDAIPVKKEVKAEVSGLYIMRVQGVHGTVIQAPKKKKLLSRLRKKADNYQAKADAIQKDTKKAKEEKWAAKANAASSQAAKPAASASPAKTNSQPAKSSTSGMSKNMKKKKKK